MKILPASQGDAENILDLQKLAYRKNLGQGLMVDGTPDPAIAIVCRGLIKDVSRLNKDNVSLHLDLVSAGPGSFSYRLTAGNVTLPNDKIHLINISPSRIDLDIKKSSQ